MSLTVAEILDQLELNRGAFPRQAVEAAVQSRQEIVPELLRILDHAADRPEEVLAREAYLGDVFALYLLAQFREPAAYPRIIRYFSLPGQLALDATGELVTEALDRILASVAHGDDAPIRQLIEDREIDEWIRGAGVGTLGEMVLSDQLERDRVVGYLGRLLGGRLERERSHVWDRVADLATDLHPGELIDALRRAYRDGLVDPYFISPQNVERELRRSIPAVIEQSRQRSRGLITDTVAEMHWWACFEPERARREPAPTPSATLRPVETARRAGLKVGRNDPCPCGSGKKFKKCCH
jgi:hypothetical protein